MCSYSPTKPLWQHFGATNIPWDSQTVAIVRRVAATHSTPPSISQWVPAPSTPDADGVAAWVRATSPMVSLPQYRYVTKEDRGTPAASGVTAQGMT